MLELKVIYVYLLFFCSALHEGGLGFFGNNVLRTGVTLAGRHLVSWRKIVGEKHMFWFLCYSLSGLQGPVSLYSGLDMTL
ncbi:hypothetical protein V8C43DRAFT_89864 [Trichoderma afarasin]